MENKKAQTNKVFVYLLSIILILFAGFLVTKFIFTFEKDVSSKASVKIYSDIKSDFQKVYSTYGAEKVLEYRVSSKIDNICFVSIYSCIDEIGNDVLNINSKNSLKAVFNASDNMALFNVGDIESSDNIGSFIVENPSNPGCLCLKPANQLVSIILENRRNKVYLRENN